MRLLKFKTNQKALEKWQKNCIYSSPIKYSDLVWDNSPAHDYKQLDDFHYEAARVITGGTKRLACGLLSSYLY